MRQAGGASAGAASGAGAGVLRIFQPARGVVRLLGKTVRIAQHAGHQADHRVNDHHGRHLAAVADEVADGQLQGPQTQPDALVETLVPPTEQ